MRKNGAGYGSIKSNEAAITTLEGEPDEANPRSVFQLVRLRREQPILVSLASSNFAESRQLNVSRNVTRNLAKIDHGPGNARF
jgi:hypothetical protein